MKHTWRRLEYNLTVSSGREGRRSAKGKAGEFARWDGKWGGDNRVLVGGEELHVMRGIT